MCVASMVAAMVSLLAPAAGNALTGQECNEKYTVGSDQWQQCIRGVATEGTKSPIDTWVWLMPIIIFIGIFLFYAIFYAPSAAIEVGTGDYGSQASGNETRSSRRIPFYSLASFVLSVLPLAIGIILVSDGNSVGYFLLPALFQASTPHL